MKRHRSILRVEGRDDDRKLTDDLGDVLGGLVSHMKRIVVWEKFRLEMEALDKMKTNHIHLSAVIEEKRETMVFVATDGEVKIASGMDLKGCYVITAERAINLEMPMSLRRWG